MTETISMNKIYETLVELRKEVNFIKDCMISMGIILTPEEGMELDESLNELDKKKTFSLEDRKKDRKNV